MIDKESFYFHDRFQVEKLFQFVVRWFSVDFDGEVQGRNYFILPVVVDR